MPSGVLGLRIAGARPCPGNPAVAAVTKGNSDSAEEQFAVGSDCRVYHRWQPAGGGRVPGDLLQLEVRELTELLRHGSRDAACQISLGFCHCVQISASLSLVGLSNRVVSGPAGLLVRVWAAECDSPTDFSSLASVNPGIGFVRVGGTTTVHLRGPAAKASTLSCPRDAEYFGADFRLGAYLPTFPPARLANLQDAVLPTLPGGRILLGGRAWEMPTPQNVDVFIDRLERVGLLVFDPLVEELRDGCAVRSMPERTAQSRFVRAVGLSRRKLQVIERTRRAARLLRAGSAIMDVVSDAGFYDQPHLTRALRQLIGYTPAELARGGMFLDL